MNQLTVFGAAVMLDQAHMAAVRTLQYECEQGCQGTSSPNHWEFEDKSLRGRDR
jgi:hypothetical protein